MNLADHAVEIAGRFGPVIPLDSQRRPCVAFAEAARGPAEVAAIFRRCQYATGIGVLALPMRLLVVDVEHVDKHGEDGYATLSRLEIELGRLPATRSHRTKTGGLHMVYRLPDGVAVRSAQGELRGAKMAAPGIDIVSGNSVLRWPPTPGYTLATSEYEPIAPLPDAWIGAMVDPPAQELSSTVRVTADERGLRYAIVALERCALELSATSSMRNPALSRIAFRLGRLCPPLREEWIESDLLLACKENGSLKDHGVRSCIGTIRRSMRAGQAKPMRLVG